MFLTRTCHFLFQYIHFEAKGVFFTQIKSCLITLSKTTRGMYYVPYKKENIHMTVQSVLS